MLSLRRADIKDIETIKTFLTQGRLFQRSLGFTQWKDDFPSNRVIEADIELGRGFLIEKDGAPQGYAVIDLAGDDEYERLEHIWRYPGRYAAVHRLALSDRVRGQGLGKPMLAIIEEYAKRLNCVSMRFDTGTANIPMQRLLENTGYTCLGVYDFVWGERLAYDKKL